MRTCTRTPEPPRVPFRPAAGSRGARPGALFAAVLTVAAAATTHGVGPAQAATGAAIQRVETAAQVVAFTFDACPTKASPDGFDREIFAILRRERVPATVFVSGQWVESHRTEARALAAEPLIEFGNHSYAHPPFSRLSHERVRAEIQSTDRIIESLGRHSVGVRPPYGDWPAWLLGDMGTTPLVLWDVVSGDAGGHIPAPRIIEEVSRRAHPGSIVIFHINGRGPETKFALPEIIRRLRARGLRFVQLSELLHQPDAKIVSAHPGRDSAIKEPYRPAYECD
jgi:peptidoglycan/xylan/chitin deacetylase (PgdA/CDA1 family)